MLALLVIGAIVIVLILIGTTGRRPAPPVPFLPAPRRPAPLDLVIDPLLDPTIEPWAKEPAVRRRSDELLIEPEDEAFEPGGGSFGGGGASGSLDDAPGDSSSDGGSDTSTDD